MIPALRAALLSLSLSLLAPLSLVACAVAPPPAEPVSQPPPAASFDPHMARETTPADAEMLKIARAEAEIDRLFPRAGETQAVPGKKAPDAPSGEANKEEAGAEGCSIACRALTSMRASADQLCKLAGETDGRCDDARARVRGAGARVKSVCPACAVAGP